MKLLKNLFDNNRRWAARIKETDPDFFAKLSRQQKPEYLWIGCSDSRVSSNQIVDLMPGEPRPVLTEADADLIAALTTLGYSISEAQEAIRSLPREALPLEERVRLALVYFSS